MCVAGVSDEKDIHKHTRTHVLATNADMVVRCWCWSFKASRTLLYITFNKHMLPISINMTILWPLCGHILKLDSRSRGEDAGLVRILHYVIYFELNRDIFPISDLILYLLYVCIYFWSYVYCVLSLLGRLLLSSICVRCCCCFHCALVQRLQFNQKLWHSNGRALHSIMATLLSVCMRNNLREWHAEKLCTCCWST